MCTVVVWANTAFAVPVIPASTIRLKSKHRLILSIYIVSFIYCSVEIAYTVPLELLMLFRWNCLYCSVEIAFYVYLQMYHHKKRIFLLFCCFLLVGGLCCFVGIAYAVSLEIDGSIQNTKLIIIQIDYY